MRVLQLCYFKSYFLKCSNSFNSFEIVINRLFGLCKVVGRIIFNIKKYLGIINFFENNLNYIGIDLI
jgi:hypothetical protein